MQDVSPPGTPGFYPGVPDDAYHAGPGVSKSGLWTIHTKSPEHFRFPAPRESKSFDVGKAMHRAILEPHLFEAAVVRGPVDRRGNKWTHAAEAAAHEGKLILTEGDYDTVLHVRDRAHAIPLVRNTIQGGKPAIEWSGYWIDDETAELCRCRPDVYREDVGLALDLKSAASAHPDDFARAAINFGYHCQEAFYTHGLEEIGKPVGGFAFLVFEKEAPYAAAIYELPPSIVEEGDAIMRAALNTYAACRKTDTWPGYAAEDVRELTFPRWAYKMTPPPDAEAA